MQNLIENERLMTMLSRDNSTSPERIRLMLSSEIQRVVRDYLELKDEVRVRFKQVDEEIIFIVEMRASRLRPFVYMPKY